LHAVHIQVDGGTVTLRGIVPSFYDRQLAIEVTRRVAGVLKVRDELTVADQKTGTTERVHSACRQEPANATDGARIETAKCSSVSLFRRTRPAERWRALFANAATVLRSLFLTLVVVYAVGCGQAPEGTLVAVHPALGKITFKGQPIPGAMVTLHPKTATADVPKPHANVDKNGEFALSTFNGGDGAPEGEYVLTVVWYKPIKNGPDIQAGPNVIPPKYSRPETSDLQIKIAAGQNDLQTIQL
jgi:hypothetical protein